MRELLLHVGMHKTGTSSIQQTLFEHRPLLEDAGFSYFDAEPNHSAPVFSAFVAEPHLYHMNRREGRHTPEAAAAWAAACRDRIEAFLATAPGPRLILSGEDIGMLDEAETARMLEAFRRHVQRVTVIGFVRPPRSYMVSVFQQRVRGGSTLEEFDRGIATGYRRRFEKYLGNPAVDALRLRLYTRDALTGGCSIASFLELCGAPADLYPKLTLRQVNVTASRLGVLLNLAANEAVPVFRADGSANAERAPLLARFLEDVVGRRMALPGHMLAPWLERSARDIAWMEATLGTPFPEAERAARPDQGPEEDFRTLSWEEVRTLIGAVNALMLGRWRENAALLPEPPPEVVSRFLGRSPTPLVPAMEAGPVAEPASPRARARTPRAAGEARTKAKPRARPARPEAPPAEAKKPRAKPGTAPQTARRAARKAAGAGPETAPATPEAAEAKRDREARRDARRRRLRAEGRVRP